VWLNTASTPQKQPPAKNRGLEARTFVGGAARGGRVEVGLGCGDLAARRRRERDRSEQRARQHQNRRGNICAARITAVIRSQRRRRETGRA
jgi:hypothetical protein